MTKALADMAERMGTAGMATVAALNEQHSKAYAGMVRDQVRAQEQVRREQREDVHRYQDLVLKLTGVAPFEDEDTGRETPLPRRLR